MKDETFTTCLGMIVSVGILIVVGSLMNGWALTTIWNWFMPSIFGLASLTLWKAIGVSMVFQLFVGTKATSSESSSDSKSFGAVLVDGLVKVVLTPLLTVGIAWVVFQLAF